MPSNDTDAEASDFQQSDSLKCREILSCCCFSGLFQTEASGLKASGSQTGQSKTCDMQDTGAIFHNALL